MASFWIARNRAERTARCCFSSLQIILNINLLMAEIKREILGRADVSAGSEL